MDVLIRLLSWTTGPGQTPWFLNLAHPLPTFEDKFPSDLSLLLLGSGIALLIALLAWGEQIRSLTKDTRDLERQFQEQHRIHGKAFRIITNTSAQPKDRIYELTQIMTGDIAPDADQLALLTLFTDWKPLARNLRESYDLKYRLTLLLTTLFLLLGFLSLWLPGQSSLTICRRSITFDAVCFMLIGAMITWHLGLLLVIERREQRLNALLAQILEML